MKIVVDARMLFHGGIGTYLRNLLEHLKKTNHEILTLLPETMRSSIYTLQEQVELPLKIPSCDVFWAPHFNVPLLPIRAERRIVTIHDLFHLDHFFEFSLIKRFCLKAVLKRAIHAATSLITVSEFSKQRLLHYFPEVEEKVSVIHSGCDHLSFVKPKPVDKIPRKFFLFVGHLKPHKNLKVLLEACRKLSHIHLVVAGDIPLQSSVQMELEQKYERLKERLHFLGKVSDAELAWLYSNAEALIFPSLYEGWGFIPLEAMRLGCPVFASRAASITEACGEGACYFDPYDPEDLCKKMEQLPTLREKLIVAGKKRALEFSWERAAQEHLQVFEATASVRP